MLTTLILATTFTPIKLRLEGIAARRYQRPAEAHGDAAALPAGTLLTEQQLRALIADAVREELARRDRG